MPNVLAVACLLRFGLFRFDLFPRRPTLMTFLRSLALP